MFKFFRFYCFFFCFLFLLTRHFGQSESIDDFGVNGQVRIDVEHHFDFFVDAHLVENNILVIGSSHVFSDYTKNGLSVVKVNENGELDTNFGNNGKTIISGDSNEFIYAKTSIVQSDGKIVLGGTL